MATERRRIIKIGFEEWLVAAVGCYASASGCGAAPLDASLPKPQRHVHFQCQSGTARRNISVPGESADQITDEEIAQALRAVMDEREA